MMSFIMVLRSCAFAIVLVLGLLWSRNRPVLAASATYIRAALQHFKDFCCSAAKILDARP